MPRIPSIAALSCAVALQAQAPKPFPYLTVLPNYRMTADAADKDFAACEFWDGKAWAAKEGRFYHRFHELKEGAAQASELQIVRNYANAIKAAGGTVFVQGAMPGGRKEEIAVDTVLCGRLAKDGKEVWILVVPANGGNDYVIDAVEIGAMKQEVSAKELLAALASQGHVALDVRFDLNKSTVKPESGPLLEQVLALLKQNPALRLSVEGHTDNVGGADANRRLSDDRARAVVAWLVGKGVAAGRLGAKGFGADKPVADNRTEEGRAKNRRVELVKQ